MPVVPRLRGQQVTTRPLDGTRAGPAAFAPEAGPLAVAADTLGQVAEIRARERVRADEVVLNQSEVELRSAMTGVLYDPKTGAMLRQGLDAQRAPAEARDAFRSAASTIEAKLATPEQRAEFQRRVQRYAVDMERQVTAHAGTEFQRVNDATYKALTESELSDITANAGDAAWVDAAVSRLRTSTATYADRAGWSPEMVEREVETLTSAARMQQVAALVDGGQVERASALLGDRGDQFTGEDRAKARALVEEGNIRVRSQEAVETLVQQFAGDERKALAEARKSYTGALQDAVVQRLEARFADDRRLRQQARADLGDRLLGQVETTGSLAGISAADKLAAQEAGLWSGLQLRARQVANRTAPVTDWDTLEKILGMTADELRAANPSDYRPYLADGDYRAFLGMRSEVMATGRNARDAAGLSEGRLTTAVFDDARRFGLLPTNAVRPGQLKGDAGLRFSALMDEVRATMEEMQAGQNNRPLTRQQQTEAITSVMDDEVLRTTGWNRVVPRAMLAPDDEARELTPEERQGRPAPRPLAGETRETYYNRLTRRGFSPDSAEAIALRSIVPRATRPVSP